MKKIKYILSFAIFTLFFFGCDVEEASQDPADLGSSENYPTPAFTLTGGDLTFNEKDEPVFVYNIVMDKPINRAINFSFLQIGGEAELHEDYDIVNGTVAAYTTTAEMSVIIHSDGEFEDTESLVLTIESGPAVSSAYLINPNTQFPVLDLTIENWLVCTWTLFCSDTYGDGWNGGFVSVDIDGVITEYVAEESTSTYDILMEDGAAFSFEYVSGGGTGGGPGWESENYYMLTSPDGTEWEDGTLDYSGIPTEGVITSGTNNCP